MHGKHRHVRGTDREPSGGAGRQRAPVPSSRHSCAPQERTRQPPSPSLPFLEAVAAYMRTEYR